jgi:type II secretory pathway pseudopilin PulG
MAGSRGRVLLWIAIFLLLPTTIANTSSENGEVIDDGDIIAVQYIDYSCYQQSLQCQATESEHIVEYFGADWCEPCQIVEDNLAMMNRTDTVILQHHASVEDYTYLNYSNLRYDGKFRLLFIPSLVINGNGLLTGSSQSFDLNQSLDNNAGLLNNSLDDVLLKNGILSWNHSTGQKLTIWRLDPTQHESRNFTHQYLASDSVTIDLNDSNVSNNEGVNISGLLQNWSGRLIFILENNGSPQLLSYSDETATNMEFNDDENEAPPQVENYNSARYAAIWFVIMLILITPAIMLWVKEIKRPNQSFLEQE